MMYMAAVIDKFGDALGERDLLNSEMHLEAMIERVRSGLAAAGAVERVVVRLKMMIEGTQRYTPRPISRKFGDALGG